MEIIFQLSYILNYAASSIAQVQAHLRICTSSANSDPDKEVCEVSCPSDHTLQFSVKQQDGKVWFHTTKVEMVSKCCICDAMSPARG